MQIHELNKKPVNEAIVGPGGIVDRIKTTAQTLVKPGAKQALGQVAGQSTHGLTHSTWADMYRRTEEDRASQVWINGLLKQYRAQMNQLPVPAQAKSNSTATTQLVSTTQPPRVGEFQGQPLLHDQRGASWLKTPQGWAQMGRTGPAPGVATGEQAKWLDQQYAQVKPAEPEQPMYLGGKKLDPKNPKDAEVIKKIQTQGLKEAANLTPEQIAQQFQTWTDQQLKTQSRNGTAITMDQVRATDVGPRLKGLLDKVARAQAAGATQAFDQAFRDYMNVAVAGIRMLTQQDNQSNPQAPTTRTQQYTTAPGAMDIRQQLQAAGISNQQLLKLGQLVTAANDGEVRSTGNPAVDDVLRNMGIKI